MTVATCNLNQWALDFDGNEDRILKSCEEAREQGATYRLGPELEICGYGCEDHFFEVDTFVHCWQTLGNLFQQGATDGLLCDFGMPVLFSGVRYNCRVMCRDRKILAIRPKTAMADNGNYRESRYFTAYKAPRDGKVEKFQLPKEFADEGKYGPDNTVPFGTHYLQCADGTTIAAESCEELWTPKAEHIDAALNGVEIIGNGSGSHHELRKLDARLELMINATRKCGGLYLYANQRGCDGSRLYFDGAAMIVCNGKVLAQAEQFDLRDVQTIVATVDLDDIRSYRASIPSFCVQAASTREENGDKSILTDVVLGCGPNGGTRPRPTDEIKLKYHSAEEECCLGPACWLWDFLRRSGAGGYFLPLSGGADSASVATIVGCMTIMAYETAQKDPKGVTAADCRRICNKTGDWVPESPQELAKCILHTTYMGTVNSSSATESRAKKLGEVIGSYHSTIRIDKAVKAMIEVFTYFMRQHEPAVQEPRFSSQGGTNTEDLALQNIQARLRMVFAYLFAQLLPWARKRSGFLLVLGSSNVDEGLRGYLTKYDCSAADLNPIGAISKGDLKRMLRWAADEYNYEVLKEIVDAPPTAELRPIKDGDADGKEHTQTDEEDMGMTYEELGYFGRLRKISRCGPVSMFKKLVITWGDLKPSEVAVKVKRFFYFYSVNRHKMTVITPSYHAEGYSPDDNRFDLRQFLYNTKWKRQNDTIDAMVKEMESES